MGQLFSILMIGGIFLLAVWTLRRSLKKGGCTHCAGCGNLSCPSRKKKEGGESSDSSR